MNQRSPFTAVMLGLSAWLVAGCGSTSGNKAEPAEPQARQEMPADPRVIVPPSLAKSIRVVGLNLATDQQGFLKVQLEVSNTASKRKLFTYRVEWFAPNGMVINLPTATAIPMSLEAQEAKFITATAPTPEAKEFRFRFLEPVN